MVIDSTIPEEFDKIVLSQPEAHALDGWDGQFTYRQVQEYAAILGSHLITLGIGPESFVPICMDKSAWAVISMLAVMYAGGGYSPMDPAAPISRHKEMMADLDANVLLCTPKYNDRYNGVVKDVLSIDQNFVLQLSRCSQNSDELRRAKGENAAYCIFTSG